MIKINWDRNFCAQIIITVLLVAVVMTVYQFVRIMTMSYFPFIDPMLSGLMTVSFSALAAGVVAFFVLRRREQLYQSLELGEAELQAFAQSLPDLAFVFDEEGYYEKIYTARDELLFLPREDLIDQRVDEVLPDPVGKQLFNCVKRAVADNRMVHIEYVLVIDGTKRYFDARLSPFQCRDLTYVSCVTRDITERRRIEKRLRSANESLKKLTERLSRFEDIFQHIEDPVMLQDRDGKFVLANEAVSRFAGYPPADLLGEDEFFFMDEESAARVSEKKQQVVEAEEPVKYEISPDLPGEKDVHFSTLRYPYYDKNGELFGTIAICRNITERKRMERQLRQAVREKETLLKELHHRVKNNLQVISSLLRLQKYQVEDQASPEVLEAFESSRKRVLAMAEVHEQIYQVEKLDAIDASGYLRKLADMVVKGFDVTGSLKLNYSIEEDLELEVDQAIHCGLIVNELLTNAVQHGSESGRDDFNIHLSMKKTDGGYTLVVADNGVGLPPDFDLAESDSLGLQLVQALVEDQLAGSLKIDSTDGTKFIINF